MIRAAVFDFDGIILESADIKTNAFRRLFDGNEQAVAYHLQHAGISRYQKFRHITTEILGQPYDEETERRLGAQFSQLVLDEVLVCPFVPGARELLARRSAVLSLFVASGTPEEELREIVSARGLDAMFSGVYGTPSTKAEIIRRVLAESGLDRGRVAMVGDANSDLIGAREAGVHFVGRVRPGDPDPFAGENVPVVADMAELDRRWPELFE